MNGDHTRFPLYRVTQSEGRRRKSKKHTLWHYASEGEYESIHPAIIRSPKRVPCSLACSHSSPRRCWAKLTFSSLRKRERKKKGEKVFLGVFSRCERFSIELNNRETSCRVSALPTGWRKSIRRDRRLNVALQYMASRRLNRVVDLYSSIVVLQFLIFRSSLFPRLGTSIVFFNKMGEIKWYFVCKLWTRISCIVIYIKKFIIN